MERKGGCLLVPRYGSGAAVGDQAPPGVSWQMGRIMLKFRPIAPKPAAMAPTPATVAAPAAVRAARGKRKAVGGGRRGRKPKTAATVAPAEVAPVPASAAAQTAGEKEEKEKSVSSRSSSSSAMTSVDSSPPSPPPPSPAPQQQSPATLPLMPVPPTQEETKAAAEAPARCAAAAQPVAASCWVTVEDVTSTWRDGEVPSAAAAACDESAPAFVSDKWGRVTWSNAAFAGAAAVSDEAPKTVALAGALPAWGTCAGFTCRVRVRHTGSGPLQRCGGGGSVVAPCDVWRLDADGCYLWRLDLQAALTLGGGLP